MNLLPFEKVRLTTALPVDELSNRLQNAVEPEKTQWFRPFGPASTKPYEGEVTGNQFSIRRVITYRNSFLPQIKGTIQPDTDGASVLITLQLHPFVLVFIVIWCSFTGSFGLAVLPVIFGRGELDSMALIPFGMLLFMYGLTMTAFGVESSRAKADLIKLFEAQIVSG